MNLSLERIGAFYRTYLRGKTYNRIASLLVGAGVLIVTYDTSFKQLVVEHVLQITIDFPEGLPWWVGLILIGMGIFVLLAGGYLEFRKDSSVSKSIEQRIEHLTLSGAHEAIDAQIESDLERLTKSRFFTEFDTVSFAKNFGTKLTNGSLSNGSSAVRSRALAWCARCLSLTEDRVQGAQFLQLAESLAESDAIKIASALLKSNEASAAALDDLASLTCSEALTAALIIKTRNDSPESGIRWLSDAGIQLADLDADGKLIVLSNSLSLGDWNLAASVRETLTDNEKSQTPPLFHLAALTLLLEIVPEQYRSTVVRQVPLHSARVPLSADNETLRAARIEFDVAATKARELQLPRAELESREYATWLCLRHPEDSEEGMRRLSQELTGVGLNLRFVPLAVQFGAELGKDAVAARLKEDKALKGRLTVEAAMARVALAFIEETPEDAARYVEKHQDDLTSHIDQKMLTSLRVELWAQAGSAVTARAALESIDEGSFSNAERVHLEGLIAEAEGADPVQTRLSQFQNTGDLNDLTRLIDALEKQGNWSLLCDYAERMYSITGSLEDADRLAGALNNADKLAELRQFLSGIPALIEQSQLLQFLHCLTLYFDGELRAARNALSIVPNERRDRRYRELQTAVSIALGDWNALNAFVAGEYENRNSRSAEELLKAAQLGLMVSSPESKSLVFEAAENGNDRPELLATAYSLATNGGFEDDPQVLGWMARAVELSDEDGPVQQLSLREMLDRKPEWDRRETETLSLLSKGSIPMFLAARSLNSSLVEMMLRPALHNPEEQDVRRRALIPAYSGAKVSPSMSNLQSIGFEATSLLSLTWLDVLDDAIGAFDRVFVPHSTLSWLFEEKQRAVLHQPSRVKNAQRLCELLASRQIEEFAADLTADSNLAAEAGTELAQMLRQASADDDAKSKVVVRCSPVYKVSSAMKDVVDLGQYSGVLCNCSAVIDFLRDSGNLTAAEAGAAKDYLQLQGDTAWPEQVEIKEGAELYLDELTVTYLLHVGALPKLKEAGFRAIASSSAVQDANSLVRYARVATATEKVIERLRITLHGAIEAGDVSVAPMKAATAEEERSFTMHPTVQVMGLAGMVDGVVVDDRFLNGHGQVDSGDSKAPVFTTLSLLDLFSAKGLISDNQWFEHRTKLRRAGYAFIPVAQRELKHHLCDSMVVEGAVVESLELRAIRENLLLARMRGWLQLPGEAPWLDALMSSLTAVLKDLWHGRFQIEEVKARSDWVWNLFDLRGWASSFDLEKIGSTIAKVRVQQILTLLMLPAEMNAETRAKYHEWLEERVLESVKEAEPDTYNRVLQLFSEILQESVASGIEELGQNGEQ